MDTILTRGVEVVLPSKEALARRLAAGPTRVFLGIDATGPSLHLGHLSPLLKMRDFQEAGHEVIILFGDITTQIGDPTDKLAARKILSKAEIENNLLDYRRQVLLILDEQKTIFRRNSEWFNQMTITEFLKLASEFTERDLTERDMFVERKKQGKPVYVNELLYPLIQGYDSVALMAEVEVGGNDQIFNMLAGRDLLSRRGRDKAVVATKLLIDPTGKKMGKSEGNMATFIDQPAEMLGKIMSWPDAVVPVAFEILTRLPLLEVETILASHPKEAKMRLAQTVVGLIYGPAAAAHAQREFEQVFGDGETPTSLTTVTAAANTKLVQILLAEGLIESKSEFRRLVEQGGVNLNGVRLTDPETLVVEGVVKIGPRRFLKILLD